jgi:hypothetical protein
MNFGSATATLLLVLSATLSSAAHGFAPSASRSIAAFSRLDGTVTPTAEKSSSDTFQRSLLAAQLANSKKNGLKKAGADAPPVNIGWDSHNPVVSCSYPCTMNCVALTWFHIL